MSKLILPWFGGGPWIWAICLLFFQSVLLLAYLYSHFLSGLVPLRFQVRVHVALLALGSLVLLGHEWTWPLAILPGGSWHPHGQDPTLAILGLLSVSVGLPYFLLVTTSPLIQTWFVAAREGSPYRLYAVSNAGSLFGLLSYPFLIEPLSTPPDRASCGRDSSSPPPRPARFRESPRRGVSGPPTSGRKRRLRALDQGAQTGSSGSPTPPFPARCLSQPPL